MRIFGRRQIARGRNMPGSQHSLQINDREIGVRRLGCDSGTRGVRVTEPWRQVGGYPVSRFESAGFRVHFDGSGELRCAQSEAW
jgi:hypothetical protein